MVRLTADLILRSPQYFNAVREREIDLRGNKIAVIENLGATEDQFDSIDLSDNELVKLEGFPYLKRLTTLLVSNNRIARINPNIGGFLPKLHTLVLTNNRLVNLGDLDPLAVLANLQSLSLLDNIVTKKTHYRLYVIHKLPKLHLLDFRKVKQRAKCYHAKFGERQEATARFGSTEAEALKEANTFVPGELPEVTPEPEPMEVQPVGPTQEQILAIKAAIASSQTLEEVARLEKALKSGQLPADLKMSDEVNVAKAPSNPSTASANSDQNDVTMTDELTNVVQSTQNGPASMDQG
ncbi:hypothetical protein GOP47_0023339 [Adiantum capillus-veneris]|uniref:U2A'/phosphoprotein 32 family A C-terminal domain-containing protein n=1 Tax=Adiantum capillus-veneris TaxID=13818 RepID=A0A9D4Z4D3_ADICA|nr:hypothetical protein GOP47_0023339 [Adiantum capillus-veneris]